MHVPNSDGESFLSQCPFLSLAALEVIAKILDVRTLDLGTDSKHTFSGNFQNLIPH